MKGEVPRIETEPALACPRQGRKCPGSNGYQLSKLLNKEHSIDVVLLPT